MTVFINLFKEKTMHCQRRFILIALPLISAFGSAPQASEDTIGPNGINSAGLTDFNGVPLTGDEIDIGQVEGGRPGKHNFDNAAMCCNDQVVPAGVFARDRNANVNEAVSNHPLWVASVMISTQTAVEPEPPDRSPPIGVAQQAALYSSAYVVLPLIDLQEGAAVAAQHVATVADVRAINMSFGLDLESGIQLDGNSHLTQFLDWSASAFQHDVLYVVAGNEASVAGPVPTDNFNGITVAYSNKHPDDGVFRRVDAFNNFNNDAVGARTSIDILAPGFLIDVAGADGGQPSRALSTGTSFAAPHVTGTVALLQQYAKERIENAGGPLWTDNARRHEVMKAVLMNSADKIKDTTSDGKFLGMERTVLDRSGDTWLQSNAFGSRSIPLDLEMGAGHLNAKRAVQQLAPGERDVVGAGQVPLIGWDLGVVDLDNEVQKYVFDQQLLGGSYVSITLAWDRDLVLEFDDGPTPGAYDAGETFVDFGVANVDLYLLEAGATDTDNAIWESTSTVSNLEHIFTEIPTTGDYEFWVQLDDPGLFPAAQYAVAWWAVGVPTPTAQGDYNGDTVVDIEDYNLWVANFGSTSNLDADGNGNGIIDAADYTVWRDNLGAGLGSDTAAVPEPASIALFAVAGIILALRRSSQKTRRSGFLA